MTPTKTTTKPVKQKRRLGCYSIILILFSLALLTAAGAIWMAKSEPAQFAQANREMAKVAPEDQVKRADALEARVVSAIQGIDAKKPATAADGLDPKRITEQTISISTIDANLWLVNKMEDWLVNQKAQLPEALSDPRVWIEDGQLVLSSRVKLPVVQGVASFVFDVKLQDDGMMALKVEKIRSGRLRIPAGIVADQLRSEFKNANADVVKTIGEAFDGMVIDPVFPDPGDASRASRITALAISDDRVEMTIRNGPRKLIEAEKKVAAQD